LFGCGLCNHICLFFKTTAMKGHKAKLAAQNARLFDIWMCKKVSEHY